MSRYAWRMIVFLASMALSLSACAELGQDPGRILGRAATTGPDIVCGGTMEVPGISTMHADGTNRTRILSYGWDPAASPEGDRIAFAVTRHGVTDLYLMRADGTHNRRITHEGRPHSNSQPAWSPDGERIAFRSIHGTGLGRWDIWTLTLATGELERVTSANALDCCPDWSSDGTRIAFASERGWAPDSEGNWDIYVKDLETGKVSRITRSLSIESDPSWSPDGSVIAFTSDRGAGVSRLWMKQLQGRPTQLTRAGGKGDALPDWSPDGSKIVFVRASSIWILEPGGGVTRIAPGSRARPYSSPSWRVA